MTRLNRTSSNDSMSQIQDYNTAARLTNRVRYSTQLCQARVNQKLLYNLFMSSSCHIMHALAQNYVPLYFRMRRNAVACPSFPFFPGPCCHHATHQEPLKHIYIGTILSFHCDMFPSKTPFHLSLFRFKASLHTVRACELY